MIQNQTQTNTEQLIEKSTIAEGTNRIYAISHFIKSVSNIIWILSLLNDRDTGILSSIYKFHDGIMDSLGNM